MIVSVALGIVLGGVGLWMFAALADQAPGVAVVMFIGVMLIALDRCA